MKPHTPARLPVTALFMALLNAWLLCSPAPAQDFQITTLTASNAVVVEVNGVVGDDRGGIAVSTSQAFLTGDGDTARFNRDTLGSSVGLGVVRDSLCSNLRDGTVYLLGNGSTPIGNGGGTVTTLIQLDGTTGAVTTNVLTLSTSISFSGSSSSMGIFSGWDRIVLHNSTRVYRISLPSGTVTDLGAMGVPQRTSSESWAYWGVAENVGSDTYIVCVRNSTTIERTKVPSGPTTTVATFNNLSDMASFTVAPALGRWYFHHESGSQFGSFSESLGYATATFVTPASAPEIVVQPVVQSVIETEPVSFSVSANGTAPLAYQWRKNGSAISGATNNLYSIASVALADAGNFSVVVTNSAGSVTSSVVALTVSSLDANQFKILSLKTNNFAVTDPLNYAGDDRGGLVVTDQKVYLRGDESVGSVNFDLSGGTRVGTNTGGGGFYAYTYDSLVSDLRSQKAYVLANGTNILGVDGGTATTLVEIHGTNGVPTGTNITLSSSIVLPSSGLYSARVGVFSGWGRIILHNDTNAYSINTASGAITNLGTMTRPTRQASESWAYWGVAEYWGGNHYMVYARDAQTIVRARIPDGATTVVSTFNNLYDMANFTVVPHLSRWYFHDETVNQFTNYGNYGAEILGYADATLLFQVATIVSQPQSLTVTVGSNATFSVTATPVSPAFTLTYQWKKNGASITGATNSTLVFSSAQLADAGTYSVTVHGGGAPVDSASATLTVLPNAAPVFTLPGTVTINEDAAAQTNFVTAIGPGAAHETNQTLTVTASSSATNLTGPLTVSYAGGTASIAFTPVADAFGSATITVIVADSGGTASGGVDRATNSYTVNVTSVNDPPSATLLTNNVVVLEDSGAYSAAILSSISAGPANEGQSVTITTTNNNAALFASNPAISAAGVLTFTPATNANGSATVTYVLSDSMANVTNTFTLTVTAVNDIPVANAQSVTNLEDVAFGITLTGSDVEGSSLTFTVVSGPTNGVLTGTAPNLTYTPATNYFGGDSFTFKVNDGTVDSAAATISLTITAVNDAPSIAFITNSVVVLEDSGANTISNFAAYVTGPANEAGQAVTNVVTSNDNTVLFSVAPSVGTNGTLTFTPAAHANGSATVTVIAQDDGGTGNGGVNLTTNTFTLTVTGVNDAPTVTLLTNNVVVLEDSGANTVSNFAAYVTGPANEAGQAITNVTIVSVTNSALFSAGPTLGTDGTLTFTPATNANGTALVTFTLTDDGGTANGGVNTSANVAFLISVTPVNDAPLFTKGADQTLLEDSGPVSVTGWATSISTGPTNESAQSLAFNVSNNSSNLFGVQPAIATNGTLTFTPAANAFGTATVTVTLSDDGGTANSGADTSAAQTFVITVTGVNDAPTVTLLTNNVVVLEDSGTTTVSNFAAYVTGPANESGQTVTNVSILSVTNSSLFSAGPALGTDGTLTFTPTANANGTALVTFTVTDDGGTANSGVNTSASVAFLVSVTSVNDAPSIAFTTNHYVVLEDSGAASVSSFAVFTLGPADESGQAVTNVTTSNDNAALFSVAPGIGTNGTLTFTPAVNANGSAVVTVVAQDNGGTDNGGVNLTTNTFTLTVTGVNDAPSIVFATNNYVVVEDSGTASVNGFATFILGPADESGQAVTNVITSNDNAALFSVTPVIGTNGTLTFTPAANANGSATVTVVAQDNGGTANGGANLTTNTFTLTVLAVNDAPTVLPLTNSVAVLEDSGASTVTNFAAFVTGPANESGQAITNVTIVSVTNNSLFSAGPVLGTDGALTFTPAANANGTALVTFTVTDDGGTNHGGVNTSASVAFVITVTGVNDAPTVTLLTNHVVVLEDSGANTISNFAAYAVGPANESGQVITNVSILSVTNSVLFTTGPALGTDGTLTFTPAANANGMALVTFTVTDDGGTANGGVDTSANVAFLITLTPVNDAPTVTLLTNSVVVLEDSGANTVSNFAAYVTGPANESGQTVTNVTTSNDNAALFNVAPSVGTNGTLTFTPAAHANGSATVTVVARDDGGTDNGGVNLTTNTFTLTVTGVNDAPTVTLLTNSVVVLEDSGANTVSNFAAYVTGPANESGQAVTNVTTSNDNASLFSVPPGIGTNGTLTFTPAGNANGSAVVTVVAQDDGGTESGGVNLTTNTFTITVTGVNDAPTVTLLTNNLVVLEDSGGNTVSNFAAYATGPANESGQTITNVTIVSVTNSALFSAGPALGTDGTLTFTPTANANGTALVTFTVTDDGGTDNAGVNTSANAGFLITVTSVNDAPTVTLLTNHVVVLEDSGGNTISNFAAYATGPANESGQTITNVTILSVTNSALFSAGPALGTDGTLTFTPTANANGAALVTFTVTDDGGTANGGLNTSASVVFLISVTSVNDAPTVTLLTNNLVVLEDSGVNTVSNFATYVTGPANESGQGITNVTIINVTNSALFSAGPVLGTDGTLTFTPTANANGTALVTFTVTDDGGTNNGGVDTSANVAFLITVTGVNDAPTVTLLTNSVVVLEDSGANTVSNFAAYVTGPANESGQTVTNVTTSNDNAALFNVAPSVGTNGTLTFTPVAHANGSATVTVIAQDDGDTDNGGVNLTTNTFILTVTGVNDAPTVTLLTNNVVVLEDSGGNTVSNFATYVTGPANESGQAITNVTILSVTNIGLFSAGPALGADGTLTFTPAAHAHGTALVTFTVTDNGGTANGGVNTSASVAFLVSVTSVNDAPSVVFATNNYIVLEDGGAATVTNFAVFVTGPANESSQTVTNVTTSNDNAALFSMAPVLGTNGTLTFTPAAHANGVATVTVIAQDDGGTANGGVNATTNTFTLTVTSVNDAPTVTLLTNHVVVLEDSGGNTISNFAAYATGPANESGQTITNVTILSVTNSALFSAGPALGTDGTLTFTPTANANGAALVTFTVTDDGGTANGGLNTSASVVFLISVTSVNDAPSFNLTATNYVVIEETGAQTIPNAVTNILAGPADEAAQTVNFEVSNNASNLFSAQPVISGTGTLTFTPAASANGSATVTVVAHDNGGTASGGVDASAAQTFTIVIAAVNDPPTVTLLTNSLVVLEDAGAQTWTNFTLFAAPVYEAGQSITNVLVSNNNSNLFSVQPGVDTNGTLTFTTALNAYGSAVVTVIAQDDGGTSNGGVDLSAAATFTITVTPVNDPPVANAGSNQLVNFPQAVSLIGTASDVETPTNGLSWSWSYQSGPGTIFFDDETALATTASFSTGGVYVIRLSVSDGELTGTSDVTVFVNQAPGVNAGTNQTVTRPAAALLSGSVEDDGLPVGASLTLLWSKLDGPGTVNFGTPNQPSTTATFSKAGTYVLQLLASDTSATGTNTVVIEVLPSPNNLPPLVHAGMDLVIGLTNRAVLNGSVADDDFYDLGYLGITWAMVSGPTNGTVTFTDTNAAVTTAIFSEPGTYVLRLTGDDAEYSASDEVSVTIYLNNLPPIVDAGPDVVLAGLEGRPVFSSGRGTGRILVNHDEWTFSDTGFAEAPIGAPQFALNVASWFTRGRPGKFLAYSSNFGLTQTNLAVTLTGAGHQWTVDATLPFTLATLMTYDAVFLAGNEVDNQVLIDYVRAGGSVYLCAGTGTGSGPAEALQWNDFLREFGLEYAEAPYNTVGGTFTIGSTHYVFRGVDQLYYLNGNSVNKLDPYDPQSSLLQVIESDGTVAAFDPVGNPLVLHGTAIDDGKPVGSTLTFLWEKADGPGDVHFGSSNAPVTTVVFSAAGTYVLRLTASDGELSGTNELVVTVDGNEPPLVNAGSDQTITLPAQVLLQGSVTNDAFPVGSVVMTVWSKLLGPGEVGFANANQLTTTASFTVPGSYTLMLTASDGESSASDLVRVVVNRVCVTNLNGLAAWWPLDGTLSDFYGGNTGVPVASAVFTNGNVGQGLRFDGSLDGVFIPASPALDVGLGGGLTIETWVRPATAYATYPFVTWATTNGAAATGVQLAMEFGGALFAALTDTNGTAHVVAVPGPLPNGDGRLLRGSIFQHVAITYDQFSGAAALYLDGQAIVQTNLGSFVPQTSFDLWLGTVPGGAVLDGVLDEVAIHRRALAAEEIRAVVEANYNGRCKDLQVNAGLDLALVLPETRVLTGLVGGGPVLTGGVYQVTWSLVSGPTNGSVEFTATNALATTATFSAPGEYLLSLEATAGVATASDQVRVTVHPASTINQPPFVQAGSDQTNLIAHTFALNGSFTDDGLPGLAPTTARWRVFDGPTTDALFGDVSAPITTVRFYMGGTYVLRLTANDGTYAGSDDVTIRVIQNFAPGVSADPTVTTSNYLAVLRGNVTDDGLPGTGVTQQWSQVTGPGTVTFATPSAPQTVASFPALGQYRLQLTVTDGELTSSAGVIVNVVAPANQAPVVNAGSDRTVASGVAVRLDGTVRDDGQPTGNVTTTWSQLPGSGTASFTTVNGEWHVTLSGPGTFQLRLTASDGSLSASDDVELTAVSPTGSPSIQLTAPTNNAPFTAGDTLTLSASVTTPGTTARQVEFFLGDQSQGVVTNSPFDLPWVALVGTNSLTALVTDNLGQTALSLAVLVRVQASPTNQPPLARSDSTAVDRNTLDNLIVVLANDVDPDGDALAIATVSTPANGTAGVAPGSSIVRYTPLAGFVGTDSFSYTVSDGFGGYATGAVTVVVGTTNRPPLALADALRVEPDSTGTILSVLANDHDPDHDFIALTNVSNATTGTVALYFTAGATQAYAVSYTPPVGYRGPAEFSYTVTDVHGASATGVVSVTVLEPNRIPSAVPDTFTVESESLTNLFAVLANDTDPDADALVITGWQQPLHGSLFIVPGQTTLHYQPDPGYFGPDDFQYEVSDGRGGVAIGAVTITVRPPNNAPVTLDDAFAVRTDSTNNVLLVLNNDPDPDGDPLVITTNTAPEFGTVSIAPGGTNLLYTALPGSTNTDTFIYTISDGRGGEATATVTITVGGNTTPLARSDAASALVDSTDNAIPVLVNDADPDGDTLVITAVGTPSQGGSVTISGTNVLYTPLSGFTGTESFTYTLGDGNGGEATAIVTVTVSAPNVAPVAVADTAFVLTNSGPNVILVLTNDTDANFDTLFVSAVTQPAHGSVVNQSTLVTYTPATGYLGNDSFTYVVGDGRGGYATGAVSVVVIESNTVPVAQDDLFRVFANGTTTSLRVLANDTDADGHALTIISTDTPTQGSVTILPGGTNLAYTAPVDITGWDSFTYTISDGRGGTATATVYVQLQVLLPPSIELTSPADGATYVGGATVPVTAAVYAPNTTVTRVEFFLDGLPWRVFTNAPYTFNWTAFAGTRELTAKVTDHLGQTAESDPVTITVSVPAGDANPPVAIITNLPPHVSQVDGLTVTNEIALIRDGLFALRGTADDADAGDAVSYRILLYLADGTFIADVTPGTVDADGFHAGRVSDDVLGTNNFTGLQNDIYELELVVRGGFQEARTRQRFALDSNLKIGQFSFTQQDMVIPVSGFPLTVLRTYNTFNPAAGDFGYSWTWSINDLDIVLDETREEAQDFDTEEFFSMRVGGGRDITLTLPDGRRTTFFFSLKPTPDPWLKARWTAPPGVHATLVPTVDDRLILPLPPLDPYWQEAGAQTSMEAYDFPGFILTTKDGTQYHLDRPNGGDHQVEVSPGEFDYVPAAYGKPFLKRIVQRNGNSIELSADRVQHFDALGQPTRALVFTRNGEGRVSAITDPNNQDTNGVAVGPPAVRYGYDARGNLTQVHKLVSFSATATNELTTTYVYDHAVFPHYLTRIIDPRGFTPLRSLYDDNGLLIGTVDAAGRTNKFVHDVNNRREVLFDRQGNQTQHFYDARGNVTATINALGETVTRTYDDLDNLLTETNAAGEGMLHGYDASGNRTASTNALGHFTLTTYTSDDQVATMTDARGFTTTNAYDSLGNLRFTTNALGQVTEFVYDAQSRLTAQVDAQGNVTTNTYDGLGNLLTTQQKDAAGNVLSSASFTYDNNGRQLTSSTTRTLSGGGTQTITRSTEYDQAGRVVRSVDADGEDSRTEYNEIDQPAVAVDKLERNTTFTYDARGQLRHTVHPDLTVDGSAYDEEGRRVFSTNRLGRVTQFAYDPLGRMTNSWFLSSTGAVSLGRTAFDDAGRVAWTQDPRGTVTAFGYDAAGRRTSVTNGWGTALAQVSFTQYDENGNQTIFTDALNRSSTNVYDALSRVTSTLRADGLATQTIYDSLGRRFAQSDAAGVWTTFGYDALGRMTSVTNAWGTTNETVTRYAFDEVGNRTNQVDALLRETRYEYDALGRRTKRTQPAGQVETYAYNALGSLTNRVDFTGKTTKFFYDVMNRLVEKRPDASFSAPSITYAYDALGLRTNMTDASGTTRWTYDERARLQTKTVQWTGQPAITLTYTNDTAGLLTGVASSTAGGVSTGYGYDALGRLGTVGDAHAGGASYTYTGVGSLESVTTANGVYHAWQYDSLNRLTNLTVGKGLNPLANYAYRLGPTGNRTNVTELSGRTATYAYDSLYRLQSETVAGAPAAGTASYTLDAVGNRLGRSSTLTGVANQAFTYNANDWLTRDTNDNNGNTIVGVNALNVAVGSGYDFENRLEYQSDGVREVTLRYDGDGNRVRKSVNDGTNIVTTYYLVDTRNLTGYAQVLEEYVSTNGSALTLNSVYSYGHDLLAQDRWTGAQWQLSYYGYDGHGSVRSLTDTAGLVTDSYEYDAFGKLIAQTPNSELRTPNLYLYAGEQFDPDLGLYYNRARYLNPDTGRFWNMDTYEGSDGEPMSLHKYLYAHGNPVNMIDPSGHLVSTAETSAATSTATTLNTLSMSLAISALLNYQIYSGVKAAYENYELKQVAQRLGVEIEPAAYTRELEYEEDSGGSRRRRPSGWKYFAHGTSTGAWSGSSILANGGGDFGTGFYTFEANIRGLLWAGKRALSTSRSSRSGGVPFILVAKISDVDFGIQMLNSLNLANNAALWTSQTSTFLGNGGHGLTGHTVVIGPLSVEGRGLPPGGIPTINTDAPNQWKWENVSKLSPAAIIPVFKY